MTRQIACLVLPLLACCLACGRGAPAGNLEPIVDLITEFPHAEARPSDTYALAFHDAAGTTLAALVGPAPGRLVWTLSLPHDAALRLRVAAAQGPVRVRIGVSDARVYETLAERTILPGTPWSDVAVDLSAYAGPKLSLFYHPDRRAWRINLSADAPAGPAIVAYASPQIVAPAGAAGEYARRRASVATHSEAR